MTPAPPDEPSTRLSLLIRVRDGAADGWAEFFVRYQPLVRAWCAGRRLDPDTADDVVQTLMAEIPGKLRTYIPKEDCEGAFRKWLRVVVRNLIADAFRARARKPGGHGTGGDLHAERMGEVSAAECDSVADELSSGLWARFALVEAQVRRRVAADTWAVFEACVYRRRPIGEVAAESGKSYGTVCRAMNRVRKMMAEEADLLPLDPAVPSHDPVP